MAQRKLITKTIEKTLPPLGATSEERDPMVRVKLFTPWTNWTWYLTEYDPKTEMAFGLTVGHEEELGYISLAELASIRGPAGLKIERDEYFRPAPLSIARRR